MKKTALTLAASLAATTALGQVTIDGVKYSTDYSPNSITGVYICTPIHVETGDCSAVDQEYYRQQAQAQFGPWSILHLEGTNDDTGENTEILVLNGGISTGVADNLDAALAKYPNIEYLVLSSRGGNPDEGSKLFHIVRKHGVKTWVPYGHKCMSACAEVFLAGSERYITGVVGFHSAWYNWTPGLPTDRDELVDFISDAAQKHQANFAAQRFAAGLNGEFTIDIAAAEGEFLVFANSTELDLYTDPNCFDCVDHTQFMRTPEQAIEQSPTDHISSYTINIKTHVAGVIN